MLPAVKFLVEVIGADVNALRPRRQLGRAPRRVARRHRDDQVPGRRRAPTSRVVNRDGQTTVDLANGPVQRVQPFPETIDYLETLGAKNNHKCVSC